MAAQPRLLSIPSGVNCEPDQEHKVAPVLGVHLQQTTINSGSAPFSKEHLDHLHREASRACILACQAAGRTTCARNFLNPGFDDYYPTHKQYVRQERQAFEDYSAALCLNLCHNIYNYFPPEIRTVIFDNLVERAVVNVNNNSETWKDGSYRNLSTIWHPWHHFVVFARWPPTPRHPGHISTNHIWKQTFVGPAILYELRQTWYRHTAFFLDGRKPGELLQFLDTDWCGYGILPRDVVTKYALEITLATGERLVDDRCRGVEVDETVASLRSLFNLSRPMYITCTFTESYKRARSSSEETYFSCIMNRLLPGLYGLVHPLREALKKAKIHLLIIFTAQFKTTVTIDLERDEFDLRAWQRKYDAFWRKRAGKFSF